MKIRLEPEKTSVRITKPEFECLLNVGTLTCDTTFPNGRSLAIDVSLGDEKSLKYQNDAIMVVLPNHILQTYIPHKTGLSFYFSLENKTAHELLFEVDIKKTPLGAKRQQQSF